MPTQNLPNNQANANRDSAKDVSVVKEGFFENEPSAGNKGDVSTKDLKENKSDAQGKDEKNEPKEPSADTKALQDIIKQQAKTIKSFEEQMKSLSSDRKKQQEEESVPKDLYEAVGVDKENFIFDFDEAVSDPDSDSGRVMKAMNAMTLHPMLEKQKQEIIGQVTKALEAQKAEKAIGDFRQKTGLQDDGDFMKFQEFVNNRNFTLEDAYKLFSLENGGNMPNVQQPNAGNLMRFLGNRQSNQDSFPVNTNNVQSFGNNGSGKMSLKDILGE